VAGYSLGVTRGVSIGRAATLIGVPASTVRSWGERYGVPSSSRTEGGHRRFTEDDLVQIALMRDEISTGASAADAAAHVLRLTRPNESPTGAALRNVLDSWRAADPIQMRRSLEAARRRLGLDSAVGDIALPALQIAGVRWEVGVCDVGEEHLATDVIRTWLGGLRSAAAEPARDPPLLVACAPTESHTVGAEAFTTLLAHRRLPVILLGAATPAKSLWTLAANTNAWGVVVVAHVPSARQSGIQAATRLADTSAVRVFCAGRAVHVRRRATPRSMTLLPDDVRAAADVVATEWPRVVVASDTSTE
jgi:DNA-binding transcriptional MerR regulator